MCQGTVHEHMQGLPHLQFIRQGVQILQHNCVQGDQQARAMFSSLLPTPLTYLRMLLPGTLLLQ